MVQPQAFERPKLVFVERILGWLNGNTTAPADGAAEDFDFYTAEEGLLDN